MCIIKKGDATLDSENAPSERDIATLTSLIEHLMSAQHC